MNSSDSPQFSFSDEAIYQNPSRKENDDEESRAVALNYDEDTDEAPRVTAKGRGELAEQIMKLAEQEGVPMYQDRDLVELLYQLDLQEQIPESLYEVIAEIFAFLYRLNQERGEAPGDPS